MPKRRIRILGRNLNSARVLFAVIVVHVDRDADLAALARFVRPERERVNLISFNPYPGNPYHASPRERMDAFAQGLIRQGIRATVRRSRGQDVMAACGQLKSASEAVLQEDPHQYA